MSDKCGASMRVQQSGMEVEDRHVQGEETEPGPKSSQRTSVAQLAKSTGGLANSAQAGGLIRNAPVSGAPGLRRSRDVPSSESERPSVAERKIVPVWTVIVPDGRGSGATRKPA